MACLFYNFGYRSDGDLPAGTALLMKVGARYYDAQLGRFITRDTYLSQSPYAYCNGDPVNFNDPSGHGPEEWMEPWKTITHPVAQPASNGPSETDKSVGESVSLAGTIGLDTGGIIGGSAYWVNKQLGPAPGVPEIVDAMNGVAGIFAIVGGALDLLGHGISNGYFDTTANPNIDYSVPLSKVPTNFLHQTLMQ